MKLIALRDFKNPGRLIELSDALHADHVHKGALFSIGGNAPYKQLSGADQSLVGQLNAANCLGDATDEKIVEAVKAEVATEEKRLAKEAAKADAVEKWQAALLARATPDKPTAAEKAADKAEAKAEAKAEKAADKAGK